MGDLNDFDDNYDWDASLDLTPYNENNISLVREKSEEKDNKGLERAHIKVLSESFGHSTFRTLQWKIIRSIMIEKKDVCAIMATGYGKSLCYQFPSVFTGGVTIVISPLISLMEDQVLNLKISNIPACLLGSAQTQKSKVLTEIMSNKYRIVYATPEFCTGDAGMEFLKNINNTLNIDLLAIDEAHCVSQWGHDFRVKYRHLSKLRNVLSNVPVLAVTATATKNVRTDIIQSLKLRNPNVYCSGFDRPNLFFEVILRSSTDPMVNLRPFMVNDAKGLTFAGPTIIYCLTKKQTEEVARCLLINKVDCLMYHAALAMGERKKSHEKFAKDQVKVIVATIAFGMGIDKPDVRMVIHYGASKDVEGYYQEVGRAGRDGLPSRCVLLHNTSDFTTHENIREFSSFGSATQKENNAEKSKFMQTYIDTLECRRKFILNYFQDDVSSCNEARKDCCDNCKLKFYSGGADFYSNYDGLDKNGKYNLAEEAKLMLELIQSLNGRYGMQLYILTIRGSRSSKVNNICMKNKLYGAGKDHSDEWWKYVGTLLEREGLLKKVRQNNGSFSYSTIDISPKGAQLLYSLLHNNNMEYRVMPTKEMIAILKTRKRTATLSIQSQSSASQSISKPKTSAQSSQSDFKEVIKKQEINQKPVLKVKMEEENSANKKYRMELYNKLITLRSDIAHEKDCMPYMIISNTVLMSMSKFRPKSIEELRTESYEGFTEAKINSFGQQFVDFIKEYCIKNPPPDSEVDESAIINDIKKRTFSLCTLDDADFKENKKSQNEDLKSSKNSTHSQDRNTGNSKNEFDTTCERLDAFNDLLMDDDLDLSMAELCDFDTETENKNKTETEPSAKKYKLPDKSVKPAKKKKKTDWSWD